MPFLPPIDASTMATPAMADAIRDAGRQFVKEHDGSKLAALDPMISKEYKGTPYKG